MPPVNRPISPEALEEGNKLTKKAQQAFESDEEDVSPTPKEPSTPIASTSNLNEISDFDASDMSIMTLKEFYQLKSSVVEKVESSFRILPNHPERKYIIKNSIVDMDEVSGCVKGLFLKTRDANIKYFTVDQFYTALKRTAK